MGKIALVVHVQFRRVQREYVDPSPSVARRRDLQLARFMRGKRIKPASKTWKRSPMRFFVVQKNRIIRFPDDFPQYETIAEIVVRARANSAKYRKLYELGCNYWGQYIDGRWMPKEYTAFGPFNTRQLAEEHIYRD